MVCFEVGDFHDTGGIAVVRSGLSTENSEISRLAGLVVLSSRGNTVVMSKGLKTTTMR